MLVCARPGWRSFGWRSLIHSVMAVRSKYRGAGSLEPEARSGPRFRRGPHRGSGNGLNMFQQFPLTGVGLGNFITAKLPTPWCPARCAQHHRRVLGETVRSRWRGALYSFVGAFLDCRKTWRLAKTMPNSTARSFHVRPPPVAIRSSFYCLPACSATTRGACSSSDSGFWPVWGVFMQNNRRRGRPAELRIRKL